MSVHVGEEDGLKRKERRSSYLSDENLETLLEGSSVSFIRLPDPKFRFRQTENRDPKIVEIVRELRLNVLCVGV